MKISLSKTQWEQIGKTAGWMKTSGNKFLVTDNDFNRKNYPDLIGKVVDNPPGYAAVKPINLEETEAGQFDCILFENNNLIKQTTAQTLDEAKEEVEGMFTDVYYARYYKSNPQKDPSNLLGVVFDKGSDTTYEMQFTTYSYSEYEGGSTQQQAEISWIEHKGKGATDILEEHQAEPRVNDSF